jgi:DNA-binding response OmpR family regulator
MATTFESRRKVLFVDDDQDFLDVIRTAAEASQSQWDILIADTTAKALATLKEQTVHLVAIDVNMPVLDGSQFLTLLNRQYPATAKVMLTGVPSESSRAESLGNGAELYLEKPRSQAEQEVLFAMLNEVMRQRPADGFRGILQQVGLVDVIQMACLAGSSAVLEVKSPRKSGEVFIRNGAIIHARSGDDTGQVALNRLLRMPRGEFRTRPFVEPPEASIAAPWEFLLMEGAQFRDETMHLGEGDTMLMNHAAAPNRVPPKPETLEPGANGTKANSDARKP